MGVQERIRMCRPLEEIERHPEFAKDIGISDASYFKSDKDGDEEQEKWKH